MSSDLINSKLSVENFLEISNDFEILKKKIFSEEQYREFNEIPQLTLEEQMKRYGLDTNDLLPLERLQSIYEN